MVRNDETQRVGLAATPCRTILNDNGSTQTVKVVGTLLAPAVAAFCDWKCSQSALGLDRSHRHRLDRFLTSREVGGR